MKIIKTGIQPKASIFNFVIKSTRPMYLIFFIKPKFYYTVYTLNNGLKYNLKIVLIINFIRKKTFTVSHLEPNIKRSIRMILFQPIRNLKLSAFPI